MSLERRKKVMERAAQLGHCVCNRTKTCPCDTLKEQNICMCAGETKPPEETDEQSGTD